MVPYVLSAVVAVTVIHVRLFVLQWCGSCWGGGGGGWMGSLGQGLGGWC